MQIISKRRKVLLATFIDRDFLTNHILVIQDIAFLNVVKGILDPTKIKQEQTP